MAQKASTLLVARESFTGTVAGVTLDLRQGDLIEATHPAVAKWPDLFDSPPLRFPVRGGIEQATAAPGEKRTHK
jgi:hypothetical protein